MPSPFPGQIDDILDAASSMTAEEIETALRVHSARDIIGVVARRLLTTEQGGGGGGLAYQSVEIAWDTADLLTGITIFTLPEGSLLVHAIVSVTEAFDGTTPGIWVGTASQPAAVMSTGLNALDTDFGTNLTGAVVDTVSSGSSTLIARGGNAAITARLGSGSDPGSDPGSSAGAATIYYLIG